MVSTDSELHRSVLRALTSLMSQWSSLDLQRRIVAACNIPLDPVAVRALYVLGIAGVAVRPSRIANELHLSRPSTSKVIGRLSAAELINRTSDPEDGRGSHIALTPAGQETYGILVDAGIRMVADSTAGWDPSDVRAFSELLSRFIADLQSTDSVRGSSSGSDSARGSISGPNPTPNPDSNTDSSASPATS